MPGPRHLIIANLISGIKDRSAYEGQVYSGVTYLQLLAI